MAYTHPHEVVAAVGRTVRAGTTRLPDCAVNIRLSGPGGGDHHLTVRGTMVSSGPGLAAVPPDVTLTMSATDFVALANGSLDGMTAYFSQRLRVQGNFTLAMQIGTLLR